MVINMPTKRINAFKRKYGKSSKIKQQNLKRSQDRARALQRRGATGFRVKDLTGLLGRDEVMTFFDTGAAVGNDDGLDFGIAVRFIDGDDVGDDDDNDDGLYEGVALGVDVGSADGDDDDAADGDDDGAADGVDVG